MKTILSVLFFCVLILNFTSCKKETEIDSKYVIKGMSIIDINAQSFGEIGTPDINTSTNNLDFITYPIPCHSAINAVLQVKNGKPIKITAQIFHVIYPGAPAEYTFQQKQYPIVVENQHSVGQVAAESVLQIDPPSTSRSVSFDLSNIPKGFYRLYIETSDGEKLWQNFLKE